MTAAVLEEAQRLLNEPMSVLDVGRALGVAANTLHKAVRAGRLRIKKKTNAFSERHQQKQHQQLQKPAARVSGSAAEVDMPLGRATTRSMDRVAAMVRMIQGAPISFQRVNDVPNTGVLLAQLPTTKNKKIPVFIRDLWQILVSRECSINCVRVLIVGEFVDQSIRKINVKLRDS